MNFDDHIPGARKDEPETDDGLQWSSLQVAINELLFQYEIPEEHIGHILTAVRAGEQARQDLDDARIIDMLAHDRWSRT